MRAYLRQLDPIVVVVISLILFLVVAIALTLFWKQQSGYLVVDTGLPDEASLFKTILETEEEVVSKETEQLTEPEPEVIKIADKSQYIRVTESCGPFYDGECLRVRSGPGVEYPVVTTLRNGVVLKVSGSQMVDGRQWYQITFDEWLRYPERVSGEWFVAADFVELLYDEGVQTTLSTAITADKKTITVDRSEQMLYAYEGDELFMEEPISTGIELTPTPRGVFTVFRKTPTRYMQGPLEYLAVSKYYDLPGVPWNLYFTEQGAVIHGAYWHDSFGQAYSSGCVNVEPLMAQKLYQWAEVGTTVIVQD